MKDIVDLKNDAIKEDTRISVGKFSKLVSDAQILRPFLLILAY